MRTILASRNRKQLLFFYTDGQKKRYSIFWGSQTRAAQAYCDQNPESRLWVILNRQFSLPSMLDNIHVYILTVIAIFSFLVIYRKF